MRYIRRQLHNLASIFGPRIRRPVRYTYSVALSVTLASLVAVAVASVTSTQPSRISMSVSESAMRVGDQIKVQVYVDASQPINAISMDIGFDPQMVEVLGIDRGESVLTLWTEDPKVEGNAVLLRGGTYRRGFIGRHLIATIRVVAKEPGQAKFRFNNTQLLSGDGTGKGVSFVTQDNLPSVKIVAINAELPTVPLSDKPLSEYSPTDPITMREISIFMAAWNDKSVIYDFNGDGKMTIRDFSILLYRFFANR